MKPNLKQHKDSVQPQPAYVERYVRLGEKLGLLLIKTGALIGRLTRRLTAAIFRGQERGTQLRASSTLDMARRRRQVVHMHKAPRLAANEDKYNSAA